MEIAAHSANDMFSKYKYLIVIFSTSGFWRGNFFLIAPFPDHCLLVPFHAKCMYHIFRKMMLLVKKKTNQLFIF